MTESKYTVEHIEISKIGVVPDQSRSRSEKEVCRILKIVALKQDTSEQGYSPDLFSHGRRVGAPDYGVGWEGGKEGSSSPLRTS